MLDTSFFGYTAVQNAIESLTAGYTSKMALIMVGAKSLAVAFVLLNWIKDYIEGMKVTTGEEAKLPIPAKKIIYGIAYIALICNYNHLSDGLDGMLGAFDTAVQESVQGVDAVTGCMNGQFAQWDSEYKQDAEIEQEQVKGKGENAEAVPLSKFDLLDLFNEGFYAIILVLVKGISWIVNTITYPIYLLERGFLLFGMKVLFPFVLAIGALDKFRDLFWKWIKVYSAVFLTGLLFVIVNWFCENMFESLYGNFTKVTGDGTVYDTDILGMGYQDRHLAELCFFTMITFAKMKFYGASINLTNRLIS